MRVKMLLWVEHIARMINNRTYSPPPKKIEASLKRRRRPAGKPSVERKTKGGKKHRQIAKYQKLAFSGKIWDRPRPKHRLKSRRHKMQMNFKKYFFDPLVYQYVVNIKRFAFWSCSQNSEQRLLASSCLSVCPSGTTRLQQEEFSLNLIFEYFSKICREN